MLDVYKNGVKPIKAVQADNHESSIKYINLATKVDKIFLLLYNSDSAMLLYSLENIRAKHGC